jgi:V/A-type H+-transporting ATPase subunit I
VIVTMERVRIIGPRTRADETIRVLQDLGTLHVCDPEPTLPLRSLAATPQQQRHERVVKRALEDIEESLSLLGLSGDSFGAPAATATEPLRREVRLARRARRAAAKLIGEQRVLEDERAELEKLLELLRSFEELRPLASAPDRRVVYLVLTREHRDRLEPLVQSLEEAMRGEIGAHTRSLPDGALAVALAVPTREAEGLDALLPEAGVSEIELPIGHHGSAPAQAAGEVAQRLATVEDRLAEIASRRAHLAKWLQPGLLRARSALHDWLLASAANAHARVSESLFVLEGWLPADGVRALTRTLHERLGPTLLVEEIAREQWSAPEAPVAIHNPPLFRPFEVITRRLPSPRYGTLDPTPFVAVFFPTFFGLILGDIGYGAMLCALGALGWKRSRPESTLRSVSQIAVACAVFSMAFGLLFGELFGNLGHRVLGLEPLAFPREEAVIPFLALAVSIGFVHVVLGLVLGALSAWRTERRRSLGRGLTALMLVLTAGILLAALNVLPAAFFKPAVVALLVSFPILVLLEGFVGAVELLSRVSNILSYARIMALGTASVMLAMVANEMVGAVGGAIVGVLFATLFHLVNFGLGVFSPTIHSLRLHFVEFFGTFYSPGDRIYEPLRHWRPGKGATPQSA